LVILGAFRVSLECIVDSIKTRVCWMLNRVSRQSTGKKGLAKYHFIVRNKINPISSQRLKSNCNGKEGDNRGVRVYVIITFENPMTRMSP